MFLGLSGYYRHLIPRYSVIAAVLTYLTRKDQPAQVKWTKKCGEAFVKLKAAQSGGPLLHSPDYDHEFVVQTDASDQGMGAVLCQVNESREEHTIAYISRMFFPIDQRYSTVKKECLAVKVGIQTFRIHILGRKFMVMTDHRALEWINKMKTNNSRLTLWSLSLQSYRFTVKYKPRRMHRMLMHYSDSREDSMTASSQDRGMVVRGMVVRGMVVRGMVV